MAEPSRLGRDTIYTPLYRSCIKDAGIRLFYYLTGEEEKCDTPEDELIAHIKGYADKKERLQARLRCRDAALQRAKKGYATQAPPYGYRIVRVNGHSEYEIVEAEKQIVLRIFQEYASGLGFIKIAKRLGDEGIPPPRPWRSKSWVKDRKWWYGTVRGILHNQLYAGRLVWGRTTKEDKGGRAGILVRQAPRVVVEVPHLAIVPPDLWETVQERLKAERDLYWRGAKGHLLGKPLSGRAGKYLLTQLGQCAICGASMCVVRNAKTNYSYYGCLRHHVQGGKGCPNRLLQRMEDVDNAVLRILAEEILTPQRACRSLELALDQLRAKLGAQPTLIEGLRKQKGQVERELAKLLEVAKVGTGMPEVLKWEITRLEGRLEEITEELTHQEALQDLTAKHMERELKEAEAFMAEILEKARLPQAVRQSIPKARQVLAKVFDGRVTFTPTEENSQRFYMLEGACRLGGLLKIATGNGNKALANPLSFWYEE